MTSPGRLEYQNRYAEHDEGDHRMDYLSEARSDPHLAYFQDQLQINDPATAHRMALAGKLTGTDTDATSERVAHIIDAFQATRSDETLDEKQSKQLADQVTQGMTAFHDRERDRLDFMAERADYELPKTPRQQELEKYENQLKARGLDYVKDANGDITCTFPSAKVRDEVLSTVPNGFTRKVTRDEKKAFDEALIEKRALENTIIFKAEDEDADRLQGQILAEEMARRAKHRSDEIARLLEHATSDDPAGDDDDDNNKYAGMSPDEVQEQISHEIAELLHQQYEDDNKTMAERLQDIPVPDPAGDFNLDEINRFTDDDFRSRLFAMKVDYSLQAATEAIEQLVNDPEEAQAAGLVLNRIAKIYHKTLTNFADDDDAVKFHAYAAQVEEVGNGLYEKVSNGRSILEGADLEMPSYAPSGSPGDPDNLEEIHTFRNEARTAVKDVSDQLPQYLNVATTQLLQQLDTQAAAYQDYIDTTTPPDDVVTKDLEREAHKTIQQLEWMLRK